MDKPSNFKVSFLGRGFAVVLVLFIIPANYILRELVMKSSNNLIISIQKLRTPSLDSFFEVALYIGSNLLLVIVPPAIYNLYNVRRAVKQILINCFGMYVYSIIALLTKEPRPYWQDSHIHGISCEEGYASPFLELFLAAVLYSTYSLEIFHKQQIRYRIIAYAITGFFVILLAFGGIYLGQNYPQQIFVTYCYTYVYVTTIISFDDEIMRISIKSCFDYKRNRKFQVHWFAATLFLLLGAISVYNVITLSNGVNIIWLKNAYKDCDFKNAIGGSANLDKSAWIFYNLGTVNGCMLCSKHVHEQWWDTLYWKRFVRFIISAGVSLGIFFMFGNLY